MYDDLGGVHRLDSNPLKSEIPVLSSRLDILPFSECRCAAIALHTFLVLAYGLMPFSCFFTNFTQFLTVHFIEIGQDEVHAPLRLELVAMAR